MAGYRTLPVGTTRQQALLHEALRSQSCFRGMSDSGVVRSWFPVRARYQAPDGTQLQISLRLMEGKLSHLAIEFADEAHYEDESAIDVVEELLDQWPGPADLRYLREGPDGHLLAVS